jgi:excisionase family DNA binding protein
MVRRAVFSSLISTLAALLIVAGVCGGVAQLHKNLVFVDIRKSPKGDCFAVVHHGSLTFASMSVLAHAPVPPTSISRQGEFMTGDRSENDRRGQSRSVPATDGSREPKTLPFAERLSCTVDEACEATGLGRTKLYELIGSGQVITTTVGRRRLVMVRSLLALLDTTMSA